MTKRQFRNLKRKARHAAYAIVLADFIIRLLDIKVTVLTEQQPKEKPDNVVKIDDYKKGGK